MTFLQQAVADVIRRMPEAGNQTVARVLLKEQPKLFKTLQQARSHVREARGVTGIYHRKYRKDKSLFTTASKPGDPFGKLPEPKRQFDDWAAVEFNGPMRCLVLPDIHLPYYDRTALTLAMQCGRDRNADFILLNGDVADFYSVSFWETDPRQRDFPDELKSVHKFFDTLRELFPSARIVFKEGNHEERFERYMRVRAPELLGIDQFTLASALHLDNYGIRLVGEMRPIRLGKLNVIHGHEYRFAISNPVNPARGFFLRAKTNCVGSHLHQTSQHSEKNLEQKVVSTYSTGCLCDLHPQYRPLSNWNHGFAFVEVDKEGSWTCDNLKILHGKVY